MPVEEQQIIPPDSILGDAERRRRLAEASAKVAEVTAILAGVTKAIPGPAGKVAGMVLVGLEKKPETGKLRPGSGFALNAAPSPVGFMDPPAIGVRRNWWLPTGATEFIPAEADRFGLGLREQRAEDAVRRAQVDAAAAQSRRRTAFAELADESDATLQDLAAGRTALNRAAVVRATSATSTAALEAAAREELEFRRAVRAGALVVDPPERIAAAAAAASGGGGLDAAGNLPTARPGEPVPSGQDADLRRVDNLNRVNPPDP